jgi:hypothetical protein
VEADIMKTPLHCLFCNAILGNYDLRRLLHIELTCPECGQRSEFDYDPGQDVFKAADD